LSVQAKAVGLNVLGDEWTFGNGLSHGMAMDRDGRFSRRITCSNRAFIQRLRAELRLQTNRRSQLHHRRRGGPDFGIKIRNTAQKPELWPVDKFR